MSPPPEGSGGGGQAVAQGDAPLLGSDLKIPSAFLPASSGTQYIQYDSTNGITSRNKASLLNALEALSLGQSILAPIIKQTGADTGRDLRGFCMTYMGLDPASGERQYSSGGGYIVTAESGGPTYNYLAVTHITSNGSDIKFWIIDGEYGAAQYAHIQNKVFSSETVICVPEGIGF